MTFRIFLEILEYFGVPSTSNVQTQISIKDHHRKHASALKKVAYGTKYPKELIKPIQKPHAKKQLVRKIHNSRAVLCRFLSCSDCVTMFGKSIYFLKE